MTKRIQRTTNPLDFQVSTQCHKVTKQIPAPKLAAMMRAKTRSPLCLVRYRLLRKLNAHWYESVLVSRAYDPKQKIIEVNIRAVQASALAAAESTVTGRDRRARGLYT